MAKKIKMRARAKRGMITFKALMTHPMETGLRKDSKTGEVIPAHHITEVTVSHNGKAVVMAELSGGVSKNPYLACKFPGEKGDAVSLSWVDNKGESASADSKAR